MKDKIYMIILTDAEKSIWNNFKIFWWKHSVDYEQKERSYIKIL